MPEHRVGTSEEWQAARDELAKLEAQHAELNEEIKGSGSSSPGSRSRRSTVRHRGRQGRRSPICSTAARSCAYNIMYGPDYSRCVPGCTSLADGFDGQLIHLNKRDVVPLLLARADRPPRRIQGADGLAVPYVSTYDTDFPWDFGLAMTEEQAQQMPEVKEMVDNPPSGCRSGGSRSGQAESGRSPRGPGVHRVRARERDDLSHLHGDGARSVRRPPLQHAARADPEAAAG